VISSEHASFALSTPRGRFQHPIFDYLHRKALQGMLISARPPGVHHLVTVSVEMHSMRNSANIASAKKNFKRLGCRNPGTQLRSHDG
jgi:hypothetical protein